jgi:hypothetical protein
MVNHESTVRYASTTLPGVDFSVRRMSFARRLELLRPLRDIANRLEYCRAGQTEGDRLEASMLEAEIQRVLLEWGVAGIEGLTIDGQPADVAALIAAGPEHLAREIAGRVREQTFLAESERKN